MNNGISWDCGIEKKLKMHGPIYQNKGFYWNDVSSQREFDFKFQLNAKIYYVYLQVPHLSV